MSAEVTGTPVDVNAASVESLRDNVVGIGQTIAERIVAYRQEHGPFASLSELTNIRGIGAALLQKIASQLWLGEGIEEFPTIEVEPVEGEAMGEEPAQEGPELEVELPVPQELELEESEQFAEEGPGVEEGEAEEPPSEVVPEEAKPEGAEVAPEEQEPTEPQPPLEEARVAAAREHQPEEAAPAPAVAPMPARGRFWHDFWLVILGGLVGVALTLMVAAIWSGTLDYAPQREVDALSRNLSTVQSNHDMTLQRLDELAAQNGALNQRVEELQSLAEQVTRLEGEMDGLQDRIAEVQTGVERAQSQLVETQSHVDELADDLVALRSETSEAVEQLDRRIAQAEEAVDRLDGALAEVNESVEIIAGQVDRFDAFFTSLRDLLIDLQGSPEGASAGASE